MTDPVKEQLSACLDGELPEGEIGLLLKQLQRDPQVRQTIGRYALVTEILRSQRPVRASAGFADRVAAAVAAEQNLKSASGVSRVAVLKWMRPVAGMAIAAGVAAVAVVSLRPAAVDNQPVTAFVADDAAPSYTVPTNIDSTPGAAFVPAARLTNYVVAHSEYSSPLGRRTVLSGVLSDDESQPEAEAIEVKVSGEQDSPGEAAPAGSQR